MKYILVVTCIVIAISCRQKKEEVIYDAKWFKESAIVADSLAQNIIKSVLDTMSIKDLELRLKERQGKQSYPIHKIRSVGIDSYDFLNIPNYYISKDSEGVKFSLDTTRAIGYLFNDYPIADLRFWEYRKGDIRISLIQSVDSVEWERYGPKIAQGYDVFMCNLKTVDRNGNVGTMYTPYVFYIKEGEGVGVYDWMNERELTLDEVAEKWLKN